MFKRIDHVEIVTDKPAETVAFYTEVLGFALKARDRIVLADRGATLDLVYLDLGGSLVELITYSGVEVAPAPQMEHLGYRMIELEVEDMQRAAEYLRGKGVEIVWGPSLGDGYARAEIRDPNGFHIALRHWF